MTDLAQFSALAALIIGGFGLIRPQADSHPAPAARGPQAPRSGRDAAQRCPQLQCQSEHDFAAHCMTGKLEAARRQLDCAIRPTAKSVRMLFYYIREGARIEASEAGSS
jgi:hypothetical protein